MNSGIEAGKRNGGCLRCGNEEFRIDGYCTIECREMAFVEEYLWSSLNQIIAVAHNSKYDNLRARFKMREIARQTLEEYFKERQ